ncbi:MAG: ISAs1 family transposase, partial [Micromonosporaceae bacterium]
MLIASEISHARIAITADRIVVGLAGRPYAPELTIGLSTAPAAVPDPRARRGIRHQLIAVLTAAVYAVVAGYRSYTAIGEWVADLPAATAVLLGIDPDRRPSEAMIRRLLQALDADLLAQRSGPGWPQGFPPHAPARQAIAVDGKTLRGSRTRATPARHVLAADHTGVVLASTDVDIKTNEITRFAALLDQVSDPHGVVVTADALHCQRDHVAYLASWGRALDPERQKQPAQPAKRNRCNSPTGSADTGPSRTRSTGSVMSPTTKDRCQIRTGTGPQVMATLRNAAIGAL